MHCIDINCDLGEGAGNDEAIMPYISSANIACGYHAGDETTMRQTIECALQHNVAIGAHPGFDDKKNFGRTEMNLGFSEVYNLVLKQIVLLQKLAATYNTTLHHVKPHGALYNMAAKNVTMAAAIACAVKDAGKTLVLYGLNNSYLISEARKAGLRTANEVFADRRYNNDGSLVARINPAALIENEEEAIKQALNLVVSNTVLSIDWKAVKVEAQTICLHGDGKHAAAFAQKIHEAMKAHHIVIQSI
ncbi:MAG TPA: 5-oxoprolinase subunit PxpA [Chitinophagaceae bacterium]|nr:5-oxoprolinase subunit PxpA [Chitinophagaceae bacterium]